MGVRVRFADSPQVKAQRQAMKGGYGKSKGKGMMDDDASFGKGLRPAPYPTYEKGSYGKGNYEKGNYEKGNYGKGNYGKGKGKGKNNAGCSVRTLVAGLGESGVLPGGRY